MQNNHHCPLYTWCFRQPLSAMMLRTQLFFHLLYLLKSTDIPLNPIFGAGLECPKVSKGSQGQQAPSMKQSNCQ